MRLDDNYLEKAFTDELNEEDKIKFKNLTYNGSKLRSLMSDYEEYRFKFRRMIKDLLYDKLTTPYYIEDEVTIRDDDFYVYNKRQICKLDRVLGYRIVFNDIKSNIEEPEKFDSLRESFLNFDQESIKMYLQYNSLKTPMIVVEVDRMPFKINNNDNSLRIYKYNEYDKKHQILYDDLEYDTQFYLGRDEAQNKCDYELYNRAIIKAINEFKLANKKIENSIEKVENEYEELLTEIRTVRTVEEI